MSAGASDERGAMTVSPDTGGTSPMADGALRQGLDRIYEPFTQSELPFTQSELECLREVLDAATPGQYERLAGDFGRWIGNESFRAVTGRSPVMLRIETPDGQHHHDAAYAVTFSQPTVRKMLNALERLVEVEQVLAQLAPGCAGDSGA